MEPNNKRFGKTFVECHDGKAALKCSECGKQEEIAVKDISELRNTLIELLNNRKAQFVGRDYKCHDFALHNAERRLDKEHVKQVVAQYPVDDSMRQEQRENICHQCHEAVIALIPDEYLVDSFVCLDCDEEHRSHRLSVRHQWIGNPHPETPHSEKAYQG